MYDRAPATSTDESVNSDSAPLIPEWTLADRLRKTRQVAGMDQRAFASAINVTSGAYAQWEAGNSRPRDLVTVAKRIQLLTRVPAAWLLDVSITPDPNRPSSD